MTLRYLEKLFGILKENSIAVVYIKDKLRNIIYIGGYK